MSGKHLFISFLILIVGISFGDTFTHKTTGEVFHGFRTNRTLRGETQVYNSEKEDFIPIDLTQYDVVVNEQGRRNQVVLFQLDQPEVLLSEAVSKDVAEAIRQAADRGPRFILVEVDLPGGRGMYMRNIAEAIAGLDNCPTVAFVTGRNIGGAYSAAVGLVLACDEIYMAPGASLGSLSPVIGTRAAVGDIEQHKQIYSNENLLMFKSYLAALAENHNAPRTLVMGLIDNSMDVIEVKTAAGQKQFVVRSDRQPDQSIVKAWSKPVVRKATGDEITGETEPVAVTEFLIALTAEEAVQTGLADKVLRSREDLLADRNATDAKMGFGIALDRSIRKYVANKRNMDRLITSINYLEDEVARLNEEIDALEKQYRENPTVRETYTSTGRRDASGRTREQYIIRDGNIEEVGSEIEVVRDMELEDTAPLWDELEFTLRDLVADYRRAVGIARRYPGTLPMDLSLQTLERLADEAAIRYDNVRNR